MLSKVTCAAGQYLDNRTCKECDKAGYYCPGGTWTVNGGVNGINLCPQNYQDGAAASSLAGCQTKCAGGSYVATANSACTSVGAGYYKGEHYVNYGSTSTRNQCAAPMTTIGYGVGANEAGDCGRILHAGENKIYLRSEKRTEPSLNIRVDDVTYYGNMSTTVSGPLKVDYNGTT